MERLRFAPWGAQGGGAAATGRVMMNPDTPRERAIPKIDVLELEPGDVLSVRTPGGGGHGDPLDRPLALVHADVEAGLVTPARAREAYAVVIVDGAVDEAATTALRTERRASGTRRAFDFGSARDEHEQRWPSALQDAFVALLMALPLPYRAWARRSLYPRVSALGEQRPVTAADLERLWQELAKASGLSPTLIGGSPLDPSA
jgi:N-methylhydantoinase B